MAPHFLLRHAHRRAMIKWVHRKGQGCETALRAWPAALFLWGQARYVAGIDGIPRQSLTHRSMKVALQHALRVCRDGTLSRALANVTNAPEEQDEAEHDLTAKKLDQRLQVPCEKLGIR